MTRPAAILLPTLAMLAVLGIASMAVYSVAVCATSAAPDLGLPSSLVGTFSALVYGVAMFSGLQTDALVERFGPIRVCQITALLVAVSMAVFTLATPGAALASALLLGGAYGQCNPASAHILVNLGEPRWRSLIFSIKQTGVPVGGALAGLLLPSILHAFDWPEALLTTAALSLLVLVALVPLRPRFDAPRPHAPLRLRLDLRRPLRLVLDHPELRGITLAALLYSGAQLSVGAFFVVYLVEAKDLPLVLAGTVFAFLQAGGIGGRILWGMFAGSLISPRRLLGLIGLITVSALALTIGLEPDWPQPVLMALGLVLGASSFGWNGVFLAENARLAPPGQAGRVTGAVQFFIYGGVVLLPPSFGLLVALTDSYTIAFGATAMLVSGASLYFLTSSSPRLGTP